MKNLSDKDILELNELLHKLLGIGRIEFCGKWIIGEDFLAEKQGSSYFMLNNQTTYDYLRKVQSDILLKLYRIFDFYYPRWIAYNAILQSDDYYKYFSANNQLLLALTSIIDWLNESKRGHYTEGFSNFLKKNLSRDDLTALLTERNIPRKTKKGLRNIPPKSLDILAKHVYQVRSNIVHKASLEGLYPFAADAIIPKLDPDKAKQIKSIKPKAFHMIDPKTFRRLLWRAIFNSLGLNMVYGQFSGRSKFKAKGTSIFPSL